MKFKALIQAIEEAGYEARSYSGRCMYGKSCVGVTCGRTEAFSLGVKVGAALAASGEEEAESSVDALADLWVQTDSMGHDMIVYFPGVAWESEEDESEDEDGEEVAA
jgi:hypothetical protein